MFMNYKYNFTKSEFILCDIRDKLNEKNQSFLKQFPKINYDINELQLLDKNRLFRFFKFINGKKIIFILKEAKENIKLKETLRISKLKKNQKKSAAHMLINNMKISKEKSNINIYKNRLFLSEKKNNMDNYMKSNIINLKNNRLLLNKHIIIESKNKNKNNSNDIRKNQSNPNVRVFLVGNKSDLEQNRVISKEEGENFREQKKLDRFMETSAKTGDNARNVMLEAAKILYKDYLKAKQNLGNTDDDQKGDKLERKKPSNSGRKK